MVEEVELELDATSWVFPAGHRLRLSLAGTDWPNLIPPPGPVTLTVERAGSALTLPVLGGLSPGPPPSLPPPRQAAGPAETATTGDPGSRPSGPPTPVPRPLAGGPGRARAPDRGRDRPWRPDRAAGRGRAGRALPGTVGTALDRPGPTWARGSAEYRVEWPEATVATSARLDLRADADAFEVQLDLEAREGNELRWTRSWHRRIPATWPDPPSTGPHHRRLPRHRV